MKVNKFTVAKFQKYSLKGMDLTGAAKCLRIDRAMHELLVTHIGPKTRFISAESQYCEKS
jgi:hypothetical protein